MSVIAIDNKTYAEAINQSGKVIVKVSSPTCGPCKMMTPLFEKISKEVEDVQFCAFEVTSDDDQVLARSLNVSSVPAFLIYENNVLTNQFAGAFPGAILKTKLGI